MILELVQADLHPQFLVVEELRMLDYQASDVAVSATRNQLEYLPVDGLLVLPGSAKQNLDAHGDARKKIEQDRSLRLVGGGRHRDGDVGVKVAVR